MPCSLLTKSALFAALTVSVVTVAYAEPINLVATVDAWRDARFTCTSGQDHDGNVVDAAAIKAACIETKAILDTLKGAGYCYDPNADIWKKCN